MTTASDEPLGVIRGTVAAIGAVFIGVLIRVFGRTVHEFSTPWLSGPTGSDYISTLHEDFRVYVDEEGVLRCDHGVRFPGMPILHLPYRIEPRRDAGPGAK